MKKYLKLSTSELVNLFRVYVIDQERNFNHPKVANKLHFQIQDIFKEIQKRDIEDIQIFYNLLQDQDPYIRSAVATWALFSMHNLNAIKVFEDLAYYHESYPKLISFGAEQALKRWFFEQKIKNLNFQSCIEFIQQEMPEFFQSQFMVECYDKKSPNAVYAAFSYFLIEQIKHGNKELIEKGFTIVNNLLLSHDEKVLTLVKEEILKKIISIPNFFDNIKSYISLSLRNLIQSLLKESVLKND